MLYFKEILGVKNKNYNLQSGSEVLLFYEIYKYVKKVLYVDTMDIDNIYMVSEILDSEEVQYVYSLAPELFKNVDVQNIGKSNKNILRVDKFFTDIVTDIDFIKVEQLENKSIYKYKVTSNFNVNNKYDMYNKDSAYVSIIAMLLVQNYMQKHDFIWQIEHKKHIQQEGEYHHLDILRFYGNCYLQNKVKIEYEQDKELLMDWETYVMYQRQRGYMQKKYSLEDKQKLLKQYISGDVVLIYSKIALKNTSGLKIGRLLSCYPAIIKEIQNDKIVLQEYPQINTKYTRQIEIDELIKENENLIKEITPQDYNIFHNYEKTYSIQDLGIGNYTFTELNFITDIFDTDGSYQCYKDKGETVKCFLNTVDTIYAVFENRQVQYNKERYRNKYYKGKAKERLASLSKFIES